MSKGGKELRRNYSRTAALALGVLAFCAVDLRAQNAGGAAAKEVKEVAVTIDDLPLNGPRVELGRLRAMTDKILAGLNRHRIPAVGFVNESLLYVPGETDARIALLRAWADAGVELGNHTFSHLGFKTASLAAYEDDFVRGDAVTKIILGQKGRRPRYFRHPFLQMGATLELERSFESFIAERGYAAAPVTVDTMDWMFLAAYAGALRSGDAGMRRRVSEEYLKFAGLKFDFCERAARDLFGRPGKYILLLHANELNADNFEALVKVMTDRGYRFITLEEALKDPVYRFPEKYLDTSDWLSHWAASKGVKLTSPAPPEFIRQAYQDAQR